MAVRRIKLQCKDRSPSYDQRAREIRVTSETAHAWIGSPVANPACPELVWPKFAWKEIGA